jgi:hypothetical protein
MHAFMKDKAYNLFQAHEFVVHTPKWILLHMIIERPVMGILKNKRVE